MLMDITRVYADSSKYKKVGVFNEHRVLLG